MERAARLIRNKNIVSGLLSDEEIARAVWPKAAGRIIAAHTSRIRLVRTTLVVEVEDATWQKQLFPLTRQILDQLHQLTGSEQIRDIEFRIGIPRRQVQRTESRDTVSAEAGPATLDEAERIQDPVLKKIYRRSRGKAAG